jgi:hypothetical protein
MMRQISNTERARMAATAEAFFSDVSATASVTLYNKYIVDRKERYQRVQIPFVQWKEVDAVANNSTETDKAIIVIPFARVFEMEEEFTYPKDWQALIDKSGHWTLQIGDVIVRGLVEDEIINDDTPCTSPFTVSDLMRKYDQSLYEVMVINSIAMMDNSLSLMRWEVGAK